MHQIYSDYDNYRWIDYNRWSYSKEVENLISHLLVGFDGRKKSGYRQNMKIVVMDLYQSHLTDKEQYIAYHRGKDHYLNAGKGNQYIKNQHVTYTYFVGCIDLLDRLDFVENHPGGQFYNEELGELFSYVSRMRATKDLVKLWDEYHIKPEMIAKFKPDELIILKGPEEEKTYLYKGETKTKMVKPLMDCPDTPVTRKMFKIIERYNNLLERTKIDVDIECISDEDRVALVDQMSGWKTEEKRIFLRLANKDVYRVFNNGSLQEGGRFYGAWWIGAPSIVRKYITIKGNPTKELDYSGIHIHLLYALKGINYADFKEDPYTLDDGKPDRDLNKLILLTAFNAKTEELAASAVFDELREDGLLNKYNIHKHKPILDKLALLKIKHEPIKDMIANDYGRKLQYYDSSIIERLIEYFSKWNMPIITVHDSVICQAKYSEFIKDKMWEYYCETIDNMLGCKIEYKPINPHASFVVKQLSKACNYFYVTDIIKLISCKFNKYRGNVPKIDNSIISIKQVYRTNKCNNKCSHHIRVKSRNKHYSSIKIMLEEHKESSTNILVIK